MNLSYTEEQVMLREQIQKFCETEYDFYKREEVVKSDNDFDFQATTDKDVTINVGPYVSASGTYNFMNSLSSINVSVDSTSTFGSHIQANEAETISIVGGGRIQATISGQDIKTINIDAASGLLAVGAASVETFNLNSRGNF